MKSLIFSHDYEKLPENWNGTNAKLFAVRYISDMDKLKKALPNFIDYDTKFRGEMGHYDLDFKEGLILFFIHFNGIPFTTIRRSNPSKRRYYQSMIFETFILKDTRRN